MLIAKNLCKTIEGKEVLRNVSLALEAGRVTMVLGANGSSKSVLLRALLMSDPPSKGVITLDDISYEFPHSRGDYFKRPWPRLAAVFQQLFLLPHLSIDQQILLPFTTKESIEEARGRMLELASFLGVGDVIRRFPNQMSVGQRQRCAIIRTLVLRPKYLLLDEATSALDVESTMKIEHLVKELRDDGTAILFITHLLGVAKRLADSVLFMYDGEVAESGPAEIFDYPKTQRFREFMALLDPKPMA